MKKIFEFEKELIYKKLGNNKTILESTEKEGIALWWYIDLDFFNFLLNIPNQPNDHNIKVKNRQEKIRIFLMNWAMRHYDFFLKIISIVLVHGLRKSTYVCAEKKYKVLITGEDIEWRPILNPHHANFKITDQFFDSILEQMHKTNKYDIFSTYPLKYPLSKSILAIISKHKNWNVCHIPFNYYFTIKCDKKRANAREYFKKIWSDIENDKIFNNILRDYDSLRAPLIKQKLSHYFIYHNTENVFSEFVKMLEMARNLIDVIEPDIVILEEEYGPFERSLLIAAKMKNIPTIAIQHGVIHELHKAYIFNKGEISPDLSISYPYAQIADITAVYGEYHKRLLTQISSYPKKSVVVTGQPRYDRIESLKKGFDKGKFFQEWNIPKGCKLLLWLPAFSYLSNNEIERDFISILREIRGVKDLRVIIKPHPGDSDNSINKLHKKITELNSDAIVIPRNYDTLYCIMVSDIVVMKDSTTGMEAIALGKPLIQLNLDHSIDQVDYIGEGVAFGVYSLTDLQKVISQIINDNLKISDERRSHYLEQYFYKIDGQASVRIIELIEQCIKYKSKKNSI